MRARHRAKASVRCALGAAKELLHRVLYSCNVPDVNWRNMPAHMETDWELDLVFPDLKVLLDGFHDGNNNRRPL